MQSKRQIIFTFILVAVPQVLSLTVLFLALISGAKIFWVLFILGMFLGSTVLAGGYFAEKMFRELEAFSWKRPEKGHVVIGVSFTPVLGPVFLYHSSILKEILYLEEEPEVEKIS